MDFSNVGRIEDNIYCEEFRTYTFNEDPHLTSKIDWCFQIAQEMAACHAAIKGCSIPDLLKKGKTWVISRSQIEIFRYPSWPEKINVITYLNEPIGLQLPRTVEAYDKKGDLLFKVVSFWVLLDVNKNFRPISPSFIVDEIKLTKSKNNKIEKPKKFKAEEGKVLGLLNPIINYSDTDNNNHVNNITYIQWALRSLDDRFRDFYKTKYLDVCWQKQTFSGDKITMISTTNSKNPLEEKEVIIFHKLCREENDGTKTTVWQAKSIWEKRENLI